MASARRILRSSERFNSRQSTKDLQISVIRQIQNNNGNTETFVVDNKSNQETFQKPASKQSRLEKLRMIRDEKSFKRPGSERISHVPVPGQQRMLPSTLINASYLKSSALKKSLPLSTLKHKSKITSQQNGSSAPSLKNLSDSNKILGKKVDQTRTVKPKKLPSISKDNSSLNDTNITGSSVQSPNFPTDISFIHPVSSFSFAPDDFSFTVPESVKKLQYKPTFLKKQEACNLSRMSTPRAKKVSRAKVQQKKPQPVTESVETVSSTCRINKMNPENKISQNENGKSGSPVLSLTKTFEKEKENIQPKSIENPEFINPKERNKSSALQVASKNVGLSGILKNSQKILGQQITKFSPLSRNQTSAKVIAITSQNNLRRHSALPKSNTTYLSSVNRARSCNNGTIQSDNPRRKTLQPVNRNVNVVHSNKSFKPSSCPTVTAVKEKSVESKAKESKACTETILVASTDSSASTSEKIGDCVLKASASSLDSSSRSNRSIDSIEDSSEVADSFSPACQNCTKTVSEFCKNTLPIISDSNDSAGSVMSKTIQDVAEILPTTDCTESSQEKGSDNSITASQLARIVQRLDSNSLKKKIISLKDVHRNSLSLMTTCFIEDEVLDLDISAELAALDLSTTANLLTSTNLRHTKGTSSHSPLTKKKAQVNKEDLAWSLEKKHIPCSFSTSFNLNSSVQNTSRPNATMNHQDMGCTTNEQVSSKMRKSSSFSGTAESDLQYTAISHVSSYSLSQEDKMYSSENQCNEFSSPESVPFKSSNCCEISLLGTPVKPSTNMNTSVKGDLITFSPNVSKMLV